MDLGVTDRLRPLLDAVRTFIDERVIPVDHEYFAEVDKGDRWSLTERQQEIIEGLKSAAREQKLWNFWLTDSQSGYGLTTVEYAYLAEETGRSHLAAEAFNCSAPDTGNMEVLERYGTDAQKKQWLEPLLNGEIRSAYAMTEPDVASSDATNISTSAVLDNGEWIINGEKTYISGAGDRRCKVMICMVKTNPENDRHTQHSQILVPMDAPGVELVRPMDVFDNDCIFASRMCAYPKTASSWVPDEASKLHRAGSAPDAYTIACAQSAWPSRRSSSCANARSHARPSAGRLRSSAAITTRSRTHASTSTWRAC